MNERNMGLLLDGLQFDWNVEWAMRAKGFRLVAFLCIALGNFTSFEKALRRRV